MARKEKNFNQIIRLDGNKCFMEAVRSAFGIDKILLNFFQYDLSKPKGEKFTSEINIYLDFKNFDNIFYEILIGGSKIKEMNRLAQDPTKKEWEKQLILYRGGSEQNNVITAKQLKIFKGRKKPIVLRAEMGKGQKNAQGGYTMMGSPERYIDIGMEYKDLEILLLEIWKAVCAYETLSTFKEKHEEMLFELNKNRDFMILIASHMNINKEDIESIINKKMEKPSYSKNDSNNTNNAYKSNQNNSQQNQYNNGSNQNQYNRGYSQNNYNNGSTNNQNYSGNYPDNSGFNNYNGNY